MSFFYDAERIIRKYQHKIVLPEGNDIRVIGAAARLKNNSILEPVVLGKRDATDSKRKRSRYGKGANHRSWHLWT